MQGSAAVWEAIVILSLIAGIVGGGYLFFLGASVAAYCLIGIMVTVAAVAFREQFASWDGR